MSAQALSDPFRPQPPQGLRFGAALSLAVHGALVALFAALVWRSAPPPAVMAELWTALPQQAAPALTETEPPPPAPDPAPPPAPPPPVARPPEPAPQEAEIALKKAREAEQREKERMERDRLAKERAAKEKAAKEKAAKEKADRERAEREKAEKLKAERAEKERRERAEKQAEQRAEKMRQENLARLQGLAGASGGAESTGAAAQSGGPSAGYAGRIRARIKPLIVYPDAASGNPVAEVEVRLSPTGAIIGTRLKRPSGVPEWDAAVLRAVEKAEVLPRDTDGRVPPVMVLVFSPRE